MHGTVESGVDWSHPPLHARAPNSKVNSLLKHRVILSQLLSGVTGETPTRVKTGIALNIPFCRSYFSARAAPSARHAWSFSANDSDACAGLVEGRRAKRKPQAPSPGKTLRRKQSQALTPLKNTCRTRSCVAKKARKSFGTIDALSILESRLPLRSQQVITSHKAIPPRLNRRVR